MPDATGKLTDEDKKKIAAWLTSFNRPVPSCPICGSQEWVIGDHITQPVTRDAKGTMVLFGSTVVYPTITIVSSKCGYTMYMNAVMLGFAPPTDPAQIPMPLVEKKNG